MQALTPKDFAGVYPNGSVKQKAEAETVARNIMTILYRTGNQWRVLSWEEYEAERKKDANFSEWLESKYFKEVISHCESSATALLFSPTWGDLQKDKTPSEVMAETYNKLNDIHG